jgi:DNA-binding SARP family transcriptional activator
MDVALCEICGAYIGRVKPLPPGVDALDLQSKDRLVLRELWARRNQEPVSVEALFALCWGDSPPENRTALPVRIYRIRKVLGTRYRITNHYRSYKLIEVDG